MTDKLPRWRRKMLKLLGRAAITELELDSGVMRATPPDDDFRVNIGQSLDPRWGDCVSIGFRLPTESAGVWHFGLYSPARCRLIALQLLRRAKEIEKRERAFEIDKPRMVEFVATEEMITSVSVECIEETAP